ncbi:MAG: hypothetical protein MZU95_01915 [Desulfomicrobium escambiense]|nr:hypothetical protein [Desulfomicrobium escambiense]
MRSGASHVRPPHAVQVYSESDAATWQASRVPRRPVVRSVDRSGEKRPSWDRHGRVARRRRPRSGNAWTPARQARPRRGRRDARPAGFFVLTGERDPPAAVASLFRPDDRVGIKVNTIGRPGPQHRGPRSLSALAERLAGAGCRERNIIVWDRTTRELRDAGYAVPAGGQGGDPGPRHDTDGDRLRARARRAPRRRQPLLQRS